MVEFLWTVPSLYGWSF